MYGDSTNWDVPIPKPEERIAARDARIAELETENARLKVELDKAQATLMAYEYVDAAPEGHTIKQMTQQKPKGVEAYPKHRGENHLRKELDSYKAEQEGE